MKVTVRGPRGAGNGDLGAGPLLITTPGAAGARPGAALALAGGVPYLQPLDGEAAVFLNEHRLAASHWLRDGDRARIGDTVLVVRVLNGGLMLQTDADVGLAAFTAPIRLTPPPPAPVPRHRRVGGTYVLVALAALAGAL